MHEKSAALLYKSASISFSQQTNSRLSIERSEKHRSAIQQLIWERYNSWSYQPNNSKQNTLNVFVIPSGLHKRAKRRPVKQISAITGKARSGARLACNHETTDQKQNAWTVTLTLEKARRVPNILEIGEPSRARARQGNSLHKEELDGDTR